MPALNGTGLDDKHGLESEREKIRGLNLLSIITVLDTEKTLSQRQFIHMESGCSVFGYEIHHGKSKGNCQAILCTEDGEMAGGAGFDGRVWGSYLHGIFDADQFRRWFIDRLRKKVDLAPLDRIVAPYDIEKNFEKLASIVGKNLKMEAIYGLLGRSP